MSIVSSHPIDFTMYDVRISINKGENEMDKEFLIVLVAPGAEVDCVGSVEWGCHDGVTHFDHHGQFEDQPAVCAAEIPAMENGGTICISHMDADTYVGINKLVGKDLNLPENVDLELMGRIDTNGSSIVEDKFDPTLLYMLGVGEAARAVNFPRVDKLPTKVTEFVNAMEEYAEENGGFIEIGRKAQEESELGYENCTFLVEDNLGAYIVGPEDRFDPSRPYMDGINIVVVYRVKFKSISVYVNPKCDFTVKGKTFGNVLFAGHPKAAGSPFGVTQPVYKLLDVYLDVYNKITGKDLFNL